MCIRDRLYTSNRKDFDKLKALHPNERVEDKNEALYYLLRDMFNETVDKKYSDALLYYLSLIHILKKPLQH